MIINKDGQTEMIFGTGDIGFNPGAYEEDGKNVGSIVFYNQAPRDIGFGNADIQAGQTVYIDEFPVVMNFHKVGSIDILIATLKEVKVAMEDGDGEKEDDR